MLASEEIYQVIGLSVCGLCGNTLVRTIELDLPNQKSYKCSNCGTLHYEHNCLYRFDNIHISREFIKPIPVF